jgi:hypothetical protein
MKLMRGPVLNPRDGYRIFLDITTDNGKQNRHLKMRGFLNLKTNYTINIFATFFKKSGASRKNDGTRKLRAGQILGRSARKPSKIAILVRFYL